MFSGLILLFPFPFSSFVPFHASIFDLSLSFLYLLPSTFPVFSVSRRVDRESTGHQTWKRRVTAWKICHVKGERSMSSRRVGGKFFKFLSRGSRGDPSNAIGNAGDVSRRSWMEVGVKTNRDLYGARVAGRRIRRRANFNWFSNPND